jgi:hypothetical protein
VGLAFDTRHIPGTGRSPLMRTSGMGSAGPAASAARGAAVETANVQETARIQPRNARNCISPRKVALRLRKMPATRA